MLTKPPGNFSRRHKSREAHEAAREVYKAEHGRAARRRKAQARLDGTAPPPSQIWDGKDWKKT